MNFVFFGGFDPFYPRSSVIKKGLRDLGVDVRDCRAPTSLKFWARYPLLTAKYSAPRTGRRLARTDELFFVPEFCQKDVPLARFLAMMTARKIVFDPLAGRHETKIVDWKIKPADSLSAWWNFEIDRAAFALSDLVLADTSAHKSYYCDTYGLKSEKVEVLPLGYDDEFFEASKLSVRSGSSQSLERFEVLFYGSFLPLHGVDLIAEAARILSKRDPSVLFVLIGSGQTLPRVRAAVEASGLSNVEFLGWRSPAEVRAAVWKAGVVLGIFGRTEKAGRIVPHKIFQSMGMGKPVVTARSAAVEEFFRHGENIIVCDEPLAPSLADAILRLKSDPGLRERIAGAGYHFVKEHFSPRATAGRLLDIVARRWA
jgi:glycosyltransferase involved in cell wall biosynthesis